MGWVWRDDDDDNNGHGGDNNGHGGDNNGHGGDNNGHGGEDFVSGNIGGRPDVSGAEDGWPTRKIERSQCRTEEVEPGKFIRKCEKTEQVFKNCAGKLELVQSNTEHTEEDVTDQILNGSNRLGSWEKSNNAFDFPGLQSDIDAIGRSLFGGMDRFFQAAEDMKKGFFNILDDPRSYGFDPPSVRRGIPIDGSPQDEKQKVVVSGEFDVDGLAKDV